MDGSYCIRNLSSDSSFTTKFVSAVENAATKWDSTLPISIFETSQYSALGYVYGGTKSELSGIFPGLTSATTGLTSLSLPEEPLSENVYYGLERKYVYKLIGGKMCIVNKGRTQSEYNNTAIHEMGHLLGWLGHSNNSSHVMYSYANGVTTLTPVDKNHIVQIYNRFY